MQTEELRNKQVDGNHYKKKKIQPWDVIDEYDLDFYEGNILKYLLRDKVNVSRETDLKKLIHYAEKKLYEFRHVEKLNCKEVILESDRCKSKEKINLCDTCGYDFPICEAENIIYGTGIGKDNIVECDNFFINKAKQAKPTTRKLNCEEHDKKLNKCAIEAEPLTIKDFELNGYIV